MLFDLKDFVRPDLIVLNFFGPLILLTFSFFRLQHGPVINDRWEGKQDINKNFDVVIDNHY